MTHIVAPARAAAKPFCAVLGAALAVASPGLAAAAPKLTPEAAE
jgi:hypothetical protein